MRTTVFFGEVMLRLTPPGLERLGYSPLMECHYGGSEANAAAAASGFGMPARFVTRLPANPLGTGCRDMLRSFGVDTGGVSFAEGRMGVYYCEKGVGLKPYNVVYDRRDSVFALSRRGDYDWPALIGGAGGFHFSGITPALSPELTEICLDACKTAKSVGATVSCDVNYRSKLWSTRDAAAVFERLAPYIDIFICNAEHSKALFGIPSSGSDGAPDDSDGVRESCRMLADRFGFSAVILTSRRTYDDGCTGFWADARTGGYSYESRRRRVRMAERVGSGDAFTAGLLYKLAVGGGTGNDEAFGEAVEFGSACAVYKHSVGGDILRATETEITAAAVPVEGARGTFR